MPGEVFINYRRDDSTAFAGRLYDLLVTALGREKVLIDVERIDLGLDFRAAIEATIAQCDIVLVVIGPEWLQSGRLNNPDDFVRLEIETALRLAKIVIPVLAGDARMPKASDLPESIRPIIRRQAVSLRHERFRSDAQSLIHAIQESLSGGPTARMARDAETGIGENQADSAGDAIKQSNNVNDLRDYIARHPKSSLAEQAHRRIEVLLWEEIRASPSTTAVLTYLVEFPEGSKKSDARAWLAERLDRARRELHGLEVQKETLEREVRLIVGPESSFRNDIFVSYSKSEAETTHAIVKALEAEGYKVWWDTNFISGDEFSDVIRRELVGSRAVVVIWTPTSVKSKWVKAEATMADFDDKLVPVRPRNLDPREFRCLSTCIIASSRTIFRRSSGR